MRMKDLQCVRCERQYIDVLIRDIAEEFKCAHCGGACVNVFLGKPPSVNSDECDVWVNNGICNRDGSPRHYRFKSEMRAEAKRRGLQQHVEHIPGAEGDRNKNTQRWI